MRQKSSSLSKLRFFKTIGFSAAFFVGFVVLHPVSAFCKPAGELITLEPSLMTELNLVLKAGVTLHHSLIAQNDEQIDINLRDVIVELERAKSKSMIAKAHERSHLLRILDGAQEGFELSQSTVGEERTARLEGAFNQLVNLVRIYRVERGYEIFFCPKDRSTWVQRGSKAQNPFQSGGSREPCGIKVPR